MLSFGRGMNVTRLGLNPARHKQEAMSRTVMTFQEKDKYSNKLKLSVVIKPI